MNTGKLHDESKKLILCEINKRYLSLECKIDSYDSKIDNLSKQVVAHNHLIQGLKFSLDNFERIPFSEDVVIAGTL